MDYALRFTLISIAVGLVVSLLSDMRKSIWSQVMFAILACIAIILIVSRRTKERFGEPTTGMMKNVRIKYPYAYYYELENADYERRVKSIFIRPYIGPREPKWQPADTAPPVFMEAAEYVGAEIAKIMRDNPAMCLPDGNVIPIQTVQRRLTGWSYGPLDKMLILIECIFYRENKYTGKVVEFFVNCKLTANQKWAWFVQALNVTGEVAEDQIGLHPIQHSNTNPFETEYDAAGPTSTAKQVAEPWREAKILKSDLNDRLTSQQAKDLSFQSRVLNTSSLFSDVYI